MLLLRSESPRRIKLQLRRDRQLRRSTEPTQNIMLLPKLLFNACSSSSVTKSRGHVHQSSIFKPFLFRKINNKQHKTFCTKKTKTWNHHFIEHHFNKAEISYITTLCICFCRKFQILAICHFCTFIDGYTAGQMSSAGNASTLVNKHSNLTIGR